MQNTTTKKIVESGIDNKNDVRFSEEKFNEEPRQHVIDALLRYSKSLEVRPSVLVGVIEEVKN